MKELELYLHIPFCVRKCDYCDFLSVPASPKEAEAYVKALLCEIRAYGKEEKDAWPDFGGYTVTSVFFGGGTPSLLPADQMQRLMEALHRTFRIDPQAEVTMEMNPGTVTEQSLSGYRKAGINRASIGLQSADDQELKLLGRIHTYREFLQAYEWAREKGFGNINIDLISAIPGQTAESWGRTLRTVAGLSPEHISAYSLIIEEGTPFYERYREGGAQGKREDGCGREKGTDMEDPCIAALPDEDEERRMYDDTARILSEYGYQRYEISNYARPGFACRHNLGYWERKEYLGLGVGSASLLENVRYSHIRDIREYMEKAETPERLVCGREVLTPKEQMEEFMFLGLRKTKGIRETDFERIFQIPAGQVYGRVLERLRADGLIRQEDGRIFLTKRGIDVSNRVFAEFLQS